MTDWIEHNGGPKPVGDDVWVEAQWAFAEGSYFFAEGRYFFVEPDEIDESGNFLWEGNKLRYRILNQHLIAAARKEGIELGLKAAANETERMALLYSYGPERAVCHKASDQILSALDPDTIAREAVLDRLTSEAQADNMGYDND